MVGLLNKFNNFAPASLITRRKFDARVAELVDALDSKSSSFGSAGSIPASSTEIPDN